MRRLEEELMQYAASDAYPFHMPGHKRRLGEVCPALGAAALFDITEIAGFDNLHAPEGILLEEMELAAQLYGSKRTYFLVNGSTGAILTALSAAVPKGGTLLIERGCHISVYHAACLRELTLRFLEDTDPLSPDADFDALVVTSPSYEGAVKDIGRLAALAHARGALLIVDEAHGAHFSLHSAFPVSAVALGADLVVQSLHKTLPALTQTALLHNATGRVEDGRIRHFLDIYETSSPSYLLLASAAACLHALRGRGGEFFDGYVRRLSALRRALHEELRHLRLAGGAWPACGEAAPVPAGQGTQNPGEGKAAPALARQGTEGPGEEKRAIPAGQAREKSKWTAPICMDPGKLVILTPPPFTGPALMEALRGRFRIEAEMSAPFYCLLMTSAADSAEGFDRLLDALLAIDAELDACVPGCAGGPAAPGCDGLGDGSYGGMGGETSDGVGGGVFFGAGDGSADGTGGGTLMLPLPETALPLAAASERECEIVPLEEAEGRIAGDYVILYPPDAPLIIPGEIWDRRTASRVTALRGQGLVLTGLKAAEDGRLLVSVVKA